jgi:hypothetical protein
MEWSSFGHFAWDWVSSTTERSNYAWFDYNEGIWRRIANFRDSGTENSGLLCILTVCAYMNILINLTCLDRYSIARHSSWVPLGSLKPFHATPSEQCREISNLPIPSHLYTVSCRINESDASILPERSCLYQVWSSNPFGTLTITFFSVKRPKSGIFDTFRPGSQTHDWIPLFPDNRIKKYIWSTSDQKISENCATGSEILHGMPRINLLETFESDLDVFRNAREVNIVKLIIQRVSGNFHNDSRSWHRVWCIYRMTFFELYEWILKPIQWIQEVLYAWKLSIIYDHNPRCSDSGYTAEIVTFAMIHQIMSMYGYYDQSHVCGSLLYGLAFITGTSWITATVSCNATGAVPRIFKFTQSKTTIHRFMQDQWIGCIYLDPDEPLVSGLILDHEWDLCDPFFQCETPKMRYFMHVLIDFSNPRMILGVSRWEKQELYKNQLWPGELGDFRRGLEDFAFYAGGTWDMTVWSWFWSWLKSERSEYPETDYWQCLKRKPELFEKKCNYPRS